ncbi:hypothetical protein [Mycolicibacterium fortuitum]|uniref:hypothetical protein n=1 Tax=Mycolicibacterium fortuitum TaxID=1766 RepID=UPI00096C8EDF|nr:hypothetical protein [Mycolicibacterium fortuitum]
MTNAADLAPLWLRLLIALLPPILAAVLAGFFAVTNTVNRRIERIKNLADAQANMPESIKESRIVDTLILQELRRIDMNGHLVIKWHRVIRASAVACVCAAYSVMAYLTLSYRVYPELAKSYSLGELILSTLVVASVVVGLVGFSIEWLRPYRRVENEMANKYARIEQRLSEEATEQDS